MAKRKERLVIMFSNKTPQKPITYLELEAIAEFLSKTVVPFKIDMIQKPNIIKLL